MDRHWRVGFRARKVALITTALATLSLGAVPAAAGTDDAVAAGTKIDDQLHLQATFSLWATSVDASIEVNHLSGDADECFSDLLQHANYAFNPSVELSKGNWFLGAYMTLSKVSDSQPGPLGISDVDVEATIGAWDFVLGYTALRQQFDNGMTLTLTPAAGAQLTSSNTKVNPDLLPSQQQSVTFVDPIIAGRVVLGLTPKLDWRTEGTIGGFGVGSDLTWSAGTYLDWKFSEHFALNAGYRALYWDYDLSDVDAQILIHGPWIGLTWEIF